MTPPNASPEAAAPPARGRRRLLMVLAAALLALAVWLLADTQGALVRLRELAAWTAALGPWGYVVLIAAQVVVCATGVLPASLLAVVAGGLYGIGVGFAVSLAGLLLAAAAAFGLSRSLFHDWIADHLARNGFLARLDADVSRQGWKMVLFLRMSPVSPFGVMSYALGLTSVRFRDYLLGTLASSPALLAYVYVGRLAGKAVLGDRPATLGGRLEWAMLVVGLTATVAVVWYLSAAARRALRAGPPTG